MGVLLAHHSAIALVLLGLDRQRAQVGVIEGQGVDVVVGQTVVLEIEDECADAVHRRIGQAEPMQIARRIGRRGDLVLTAVAPVGLLRCGGEDAAVIPGGHAYHVGVVGLVGQLINTGQHVDRVLEVVEVAIRARPHLDEGPPRLPDVLNGSGGSQRPDTADIGRKKPLWCVDDAHTSLRDRVQDAKYRIAGREGCEVESVFGRPPLRPSS